MPNSTFNSTLNSTPTPVTKSLNFNVPISELGNFMKLRSKLRRPSRAFEIDLMRSISICPNFVPQLSVPQLTALLVTSKFISTNYDGGVRAWEFCFWLPLRVHWHLNLNHRRCHPLTSSTTTPSVTIITCHPRPILLQNVLSIFYTTFLIFFRLLFLSTD